jgi:hypothetical protein
VATRLYREVFLRQLFALLVLVISLSGFAHAKEAEDCIAQTWKGTIGTVPVMMQFENSDPGDEGSPFAGRYYYRTGLTDLLLVKDGAKQDRWKELDPKGKVSGYLALICKDNILSGTWSSRDGSKTLPITAEVQPSESYSGYRMAGFEPKTGKRASIGGFHYERLAAQGFESVKGLRLAGDGKALGDINSALMKRFTGRLAEGIDCIASGRMRRGEDHGYEYEYSMHMIAWNNAFVVVGENLSEYCGGTHPSVSAEATTFNFRTGKSEAVSHWLIEKYRQEIPRNSALGKIIMKIYREKDVLIYPAKSTEIDPDECLDAIELTGENIWPTSTGITFRPGTTYNQSACIQDIDVPYKRLSPFLSPQGKANMKAFQGR